MKLAFFAAGLAAGLTFSVVLVSPTRSGNGMRGPSRPCKERPQLIGYRASAWEQEWLALANPEFVENNTLCDAVAASSDKVQAWVHGAVHLAARIGGRPIAENGLDANKGSAADGSLAAADDDEAVFSHFEWRDECSSTTFLTPIEPLIAHMRHPLAPHCLPNSSVDIESKDQILFSGLTPEQFQRIYPGRRLLMDLGSGQRYQSSLAYLLSHYEQMGVVFDDIWAWEPKPVNHSQYWKEFFNTWLEGDTEDPGHPIQHIKLNVQPGDFLAIKLDVDTQAVEIPFVKALQRDHDLRSRVGEFFFEMHYIHRDMPWFVGFGDGITYNDALSLFTSLRKEGFRIHYWP